MIIRPTRTASSDPCEIPVRGASVEVIRFYVMLALQHVRRAPDVMHYVEPRGWGHPARVIAPMFDHPPENLTLPYEFIY